ncbi:MAG TPA: HAD family hydrolase [Bryobacteraceae bacterium]|nr:HAD family hydrolase [Bryobacteraceae bacterium]
MSARCVFLDRDGVVNEKPQPGDYIRSQNEFRLLPNVADWIRLFNALGFLVIVVTNQRGIARGFYSEQELALIHKKMLAILEQRGARVDDIFYCPHEIDTCDCRKPKPGMIHAARDKWDIDIRRSLFLGDSDSDAELAAACGMPFLRVVEGRLA